MKVVIVASFVGLIAASANAAPQRVDAYRQRSLQNDTPTY